MRRKDSCQKDMIPTVHIEKLIKCGKNKKVGVAKIPGGFLFDWRCGKRFSDQMCSAKVAKYALSQSDMRRINKHLRCD